MNESRILKNLEVEEKKEEAWQKLLQAAEIIRGLGFDVTDRLLKKEYMEEFATPLVSDGCDGIRYSYDTGSGLKISFTNGFEKWEDPNRLRVVEALSDAGLGDIVVGGYSKKEEEI